VEANILGPVPKYQGSLHLLDFAKQSLQAAFSPSIYQPVKDRLLVNQHFQRKFLSPVLNQLIFFK
jgi:hypothetical protein